MAVHGWRDTTEVSVREVSATAARTWTAMAPHVEVDAFAMGAGGPRTADLFDGTTVPVGGAVATHTSGAIVLSPAGPQLRWDPPSLSTALLGLAADADASGTPPTVYVPVGDLPPAGDATDLWSGGLPAMRRALASLDLVALVSHPRPLLGFHGMSAALRDGRESDAAIAAAAQAQEARWNAIAMETDPLAQRTTLMGPARLSDAPGSGAAGGLAYCLGAVGARLMPASAALGEMTGYTPAVAGAQVAVIVVDDLTPSTLDHIAAPSAAAAAAHAVPSVAITPSLHVGKRDLLAAGIVSAYEAGAGLDGLAGRLERIARTWTPPPRV